MAAGPFDAFLLVSFGGPEGPEDVMPFLENVTRGRDVPRERLEAVAEHYHHFGGISPINDQNRALIAALEADFAANGLELPIYWGNRNWHPLLADTVRKLAEDRRRRVLVLLTSAYSSYSGCRQYREDVAAAESALIEELEAAAAALDDAPAGPRDVGAGAEDAYTRHVLAAQAASEDPEPDAAEPPPAPLRPPAFARIRHYFNHPGFIAPMIANTLRALAEIPEEARAGVVLLFSTHSIPMAYAYSSGPDGMAYVAQHEEVAALVAAGVGEATGVNLPWELVYQSRSGPPTVPWLEPDVGDRVAQLHAEGTPSVVVVPIGFVSDHMEVRYDLDVELRERADSLGIAYARAATVGTAPEFVAGIRDMVLERANSVELGQRAYLGTLGPHHDVCPAGCCPNPRGPQPAIAGRS